MGVRDGTGRGAPSETAMTTDSPAYVFAADAFLDHWQGHRRLTRRLIEVFPEEALFNHSLGGMRPFSALALEMIGMARDGIKGVATRTWPDFNDSARATTKVDLLRLWDEATETLNTWWPQIPAGRFQEMDVAFGLYKGTIYWTLAYFVDNEIHHRGQGYVYLRSLGIEPPPFWDRG